MRYERFNDKVKLSKLGLGYAAAADRTGICRSC